MRDASPPLQLYPIVSVRQLYVLAHIAAYGAARARWGRAASWDRIRAHNAVRRPGADPRPVFSSFATASSGPKRNLTIALRLFSHLSATGMCRLCVVRVRGLMSLVRELVISKSAVRHCIVLTVVLQLLWVDRRIEDVLG